MPRDTVSIKPRRVRPSRRVRPPRRRRVSCSWVKMPLFYPRCIHGCSPASCARRGAASSCSAPRQVGKSTLLDSLEPDLTLNLASPGTFRDLVRRPERLEQELEAFAARHDRVRRRVVVFLGSRRQRLDGVEALPLGEFLDLLPPGGEEPWSSTFRVTSAILSGRCVGRVTLRNRSMDFSSAVSTGMQAVTASRRRARACGTARRVRTAGDFRPSAARGRAGRPDRPST